MLKTLFSLFLLFGQLLLICVEDRCDSVQRCDDLPFYAYILKHFLQEQIWNLWIGRYEPIPSIVQTYFPPLDKNIKKNDLMYKDKKKCDMI